MNFTEETIYKNFGKRLKELRKINGITQVQMSKDLNISQTAIVQYEAGSRKIPLSMLQILSTYFNLSLDELVGSDLCPLKENDRVEYEDTKYDLLKNSPNLLILIDVISEYNFSDNEMNELLNYARFIVSKRK